MEIHGSKRHDYPPIKVGDVALASGKIVTKDTKNRSDHKLLLSTQASQIAKRHCGGRGQGEPLFAIVDARKTLAWIRDVSTGTPIARDIREHCRGACLGRRAEADDESRNG